ncbi:MAG: alpha/beta hydrolase fold domain-containing protein [Chloroflexi bacterium]|nr:alpha/beta hydrolase fold domain-containing protein [Chloroflexota bacterium]
MSFIDRVDPELFEAIELFPAELVTACGDDPPAARAMLEGLMQAMVDALPPAFVTVATEDLFRDEDIDYAQRLMAAGVRTELVVIPGMYHGGENMAPTAGVSQRMRLGYQDALKRAIG